VRPLPFFVALSVAACDSFAPPPLTHSGPGPVASVVVHPDSADLIVDDTLSLAAIALDAQGDTVTDAVVTWTTDDSNVVVVLPGGLAIAVSSGATLIRASADGFSDSARLAVASITYRAVAAGDQHTCAVGNNRRAYCWGRDGSGQLGVVPAVLERPTATAVAAGATFVAVTSGSAHSCGLGVDSLIRCWGANADGELGTGTPSTSALPAPIASSLPYLMVTAGGTHTCGLATSGLVLCWGSNAVQELGGGSGASDATPAVADDGTLFTQVTAGAAHTCALTPTGDAVCWGSDSLGQRGDSLAAGTAPTTVGGGHRFTLLAAGGSHTCGLVAGTAYCWGSNGRGESGTGVADTAVVTPVAVQGGLSYLGLVAGGDFTCGITTDSLAYCWGANDRGQVGDGTQTDRPAPTAVGGGNQFVALTTGALHVCGLTAAGAIYCWGDGTDGQLGLAIVPPFKATPTRVPFPP